MIPSPSPGRSASRPGRWQWPPPPAARTDSPECPVRARRQSEPVSACYRDGQAAGPFHGLQERFSAPILTGVGAVNPNLPNGITIFPGGFPLYRNGILIGAIGVSGDGVDQDDLISASGAALFPAPVSIRADQTTYRGTRLPYAKFPRNPGL
jgi:hypothetical protein